MRRAVALPALGLLLVACSSTISGRPGTDRAAPPQTTPNAPTSTADVPGDPTRAPTADPAPADAMPTEPTPADSTPAEPTPTPDDTASTGAGQPAAALPGGFYPAGTDLGYRPMATEEFDCAPEQATGCFGFMVFSTPGCPTGASVTVGIFDKALDPDNPIGTAAGTTPPIDANGSQAVVIADSTGVPANLTARVQQVVC